MAATSKYARIYANRRRFGNLWSEVPEVKDAGLIARCRPAEESTAV